MVMLVEPLRRTLAAIQTDAPERGRVIHFSPRGELLTQAKVRQLAALPRLILIASRYEGVDQRFLDDHVDEEISIGDYVLAGGELPALTLLEAIGRLQPGVLHSDDSAQQDSFGESGLLDCPHYTRPEHLPEGDVPPVLLSGDHAAIARWRREQQLLQTAQRRPDLLGRIELSKTDRALLKTHGYVV
jgi:tRNA (guanine37-N1)-methyltransferase